MSEEHNTQNPAAGDAEAISQALAQEIVNVTSPLPKVDLTDLSQEPPLASASVSSWFITFMCMNLPFVGWIYLLRLAFRKDRTAEFRPGIPLLQAGIPRRLRPHPGHPDLDRPGYLRPAAGVYGDAVGRRS